MKEQFDSESITKTGEMEEIRLHGEKIVPPCKAQISKDNEKGKKIVIENPVLTEPISVRERVDMPVPDVDYNLIADLKKLPPRWSVKDALNFSPEMKKKLAKVLMEPDIYKVHFAPSGEVGTFQTARNPGITFSDKDLLDTVDHNRPLYVTAMVNNIKLNKIMVDAGTSVNLMNLKTLRNLSLDKVKLCTDSVMVDHKGERSLGSIIIPLQFDELHTKAKFHILDADTSFNALLGRPWIHEYHMVPSTLHQCIKYMKDGVEYRIP